MELTITEAARLLNVKENVVRGFIATGKLAFDVQGGQIVIPRSAVDALMHPERMSAQSNAPLSTSVARSPREDALRLVLKELFAIEEQLENKWELFSENQRLHQLLRESDKVLEERLGVLREQTARQLAREQELCREKVSLVEQLWTQRLAEAEERSARRLAEARKHEGFWARLLKMMTWS